MTTELRGPARVAAYHQQHQNDPDWRHIEQKARNYRPDEKMERLLAMSEEQREALYAKAPSFRTSLAYYRSAKDAHEQMEARK